MREHTTQIRQWHDVADQLRAVRTRVFIEEQNVPQSLEWDGLDETAIHALTLDQQGSPIATGRLLPSGQIGRMAVVAEFRGQGLGTEILSLLLESAKQNGYPRVFLHAQTSAIGFYEKHGFQPRGKVFMEANIPHQSMELLLELEQAD